LGRKTCLFQKKIHAPLHRRDWNVVTGGCLRPKHLNNNLLIRIVRGVGGLKNPFMWGRYGYLHNTVFTITAEILVRLLANFFVNKQRDTI